jgi:aromatic-L-amino-acid decarboxylase
LTQCEPSAKSASEVTDYRDWHVPLGRRFRALKLWFVIRHYGVEGLRHHIRRHVELTNWLAEQVKADQRFEISAPVTLNLLCFRLKATDDVNQKLLQRLNKSGKIYLSHTKLNGKYVLRMSIGQTHTEKEHVESAWKLMQSEAAKLL